MSKAAASLRPPLPLRADSGPRLPVARMVIGRSVGEAAALLPRLFALCRAAQGAAVAAALGQPADVDGIRQEVIRDHLMKFHLGLPRLMQMPAVRLPDDWQTDRAAVAQAVFGPAGRAPDSAGALAAFLVSGHGVAPVLARLASLFAPGEAVAEGLPAVSARTIWGKAPVENSVAARHVAHPALTGLAQRHGRGPLWRAAARLYDIEAALTGSLPPAQAPVPGEGLVPAARGAYAMRIGTSDGVVTHFARVTPTDSLLAEGGVLERSLATLPADRALLGGLLLEVLDPCSPVKLVQPEAAHA